MSCGGRAAACALLLISFIALPRAASPEGEGEGGAAVTACVGGGGARAGEALAELAALALRAGGVPAHARAPPAACAPPARADAPACLTAVQRELARGALAVALLAVPAAGAPSAWRLRDAGLDALGDAAPPARRACWASRPPARSLLQLADAQVAARYRLPAAELLDALRSLDPARPAARSFLEPEWCLNANDSYATLVTSDVGEAAVLQAVVRAHELRACVLAVDAELPAVARALGGRGIVCGWSLNATDFETQHAWPLGPPPCLRDDCPFESRRLIKLVRPIDLARSTVAIRILLRLEFSSEELRELAADAGRSDPATAAIQFLKKHPIHAVRREVRVAVLLPNSTRREAFDWPALAAAAALAEGDLQDQREPLGAQFKVETYNDGCDAALAYKYLLDALGTSDYGALSAVAGPACGAAFAAVARQSPTHALPVLAYTPQAAPPTALALLGAGDAREHAAALGALLARMRWRRLAVLSEAATHAAFDAARLEANVFEHFELPDDRPGEDYKSIVQWAERVAAERGRIIYVCVEEARAVRAALCAGRGAGLSPAEGAVWLLPGALPPAALAPRAGDAHACSHAQLLDMAAGHLAVAPAWLVAWDAARAPARAAERWGARWRTQRGWFAHLDGGGASDEPARPGAFSALLYDMLSLWGAALGRVLAANPAALDDLHDRALIRTLMKNATMSNFTGLTGSFEWSALNEEGTAYARESPLVVTQWRGGERREVARWSRGRLQLHEAALRWRTAGGAAPDDGGGRCAVQPLADALRTGCSAAFLALGALLLALGAGALAATALYCRRRAEREYRAKLEALGLRALAPKPAGLDRWEVPRERVVINRKLGMGAFGTVYGGHALLADDRTWTAVAVKTLKAGATVDEKLDFLSEAEAMKRFDHKNVVRLLGVVTKTEPVCTVMEFMLYGDLKNYLLARRHLAGGACGAGAGAEEGEADEVSARRLTGMALDAARALAYLAQLRYVHRDVAARNCLVSSRRVLKLADFGMTRLVFENDYYRFSRKGMLPVRWMAPESLALGVFSPASDVWSFGVLLYEIITFGSLPFQGLSNSEVLARVKAGHTLDLPPGIKPQLEELIAWCWRAEARARPSAAQLAGALADAPRLLAPCPDVPLDALPLDGDPPWRLPPDLAEARWVSWGAPASAGAGTDTTYLSERDAPRDCDRFLP